MKKIFFIIMSLCIMGSACNNEATQLEQMQAENFNLKSPNGYVIANDINELESEIQASIDEKFDRNVDFTIDEISYIENAETVVAFIDYTTKLGEKSNIALSVDVNEERSVKNTRDLLFCKGSCECKIERVPETIPYIYGCEGDCDCFL